MSIDAPKKRRTFARLSGWTCLCFALVIGVGTHADTDIQSLDQIREIAEQGVRDQTVATKGQSKGQLIVKAEALDSRLRLASCRIRPVALTPTALSLSARQTIGVRCTEGNGWTVYVPVSVETQLDALVMRSLGARGSHVTETEVERQTRRVPGFPDSYVTNLADFREQHLKRPLPAGTVLVTDAFAADLLVRRGQQVTLVTNVGGIEVRAIGAAISEGGARDRVRVQNMSSLKIIEGVVESASLVRVGG